MRSLDLSHNLIRWFPGYLYKVRPPTLTRPGLTLTLTLTHQMRDCVNLDLSHNLLPELPITIGTPPPTQPSSSDAVRPALGNIELLRDLNEWEVGVGTMASLMTLRLSHNRSVSAPPVLPWLTLRRLAQVLAVPRADREAGLPAVAGPGAQPAGGGACQSPRKRSA